MFSLLHSRLCSVLVKGLLPSPCNSSAGGTKTSALPEEKRALSLLSPGTVHPFGTCLSQWGKDECPLLTHPTTTLVVSCGPEPKLRAVVADVVSQHVSVRTSSHLLCVSVASAGACAQPQFFAPAATSLHPRAGDLNASQGTPCLGTPMAHPWQEGKRWGHRQDGQGQDTPSLLEAKVMVYRSCNTARAEHWRVLGGGWWWWCWWCVSRSCTCTGIAHHN